MRRDTFHHGHLRAELLERAEEVLRERGVDALSLRELARDAGVSHAAPRAHFIDRAALLDALAVIGFDRLADTAEAAVASLPTAPEKAATILRAAAGAYLDFASENAALLSVMLNAKVVASAPLHAASMRLFSALGALVAASLPFSAIDAATLERLTLLLSSTLQGVSSVVASGRIAGEQGEVLLDDAIRVFLAGAAGV